jgi:AcrR family transcriptional regulator
MTVPIPVSRKRGRPRSLRAEQAILKAAAQLLAEGGLGDMTIEEVAERAGVGKASIYRRWPNKAALAFDAFIEEYLAGLPLRDTGSLRGDLLALGRDWARLVRRTSAGRTLIALLDEVQTDPALAAIWRERFLERIRKGRHSLVVHAIERGEIPAGSDPDLILDLWFGGLFYRYLNAHLPIGDRFVRGLADLVAAGAVAGGAVLKTERQRKPSEEAEQEASA